MRRRILPILSSVVVGLAAALVPAATAHAASPGDSAGHAPSWTVPANYVALGDSYAAGYGLPSLSGTPAQLCARSGEAYPEKVAMDEHTARSFDFVACSGAITTDIVAPQSLPGGATAAPQENSLSPRTHVVTLTIGGNDVGFGDAAYCLQNYADPACALLPARIQAALTVLATPDTNSPGVAIPDPISHSTIIVTPLATILADIHQKSPEAQIFISNYPVLLAGCGAFFASDNAVNEALNTVIAGVAGSAGPMVHLVDAASTFTGHSVCSVDPWINKANLHPTAAGQTALAGAFESSINGVLGPRPARS